jgi:DNA-nicking Smr family endonuclease
MGTKDRKHNNSEADALFRDAIGDVQPISSPDRHQVSQQVTPRATSRRRDERRVLDESLQNDPEPAEIEYGEELLFHRASVNRRTLRELRQGKYTIQDEIDLHRLTAAQARQALREFVAESLQRRFRCVRVVHGKGHGSGPGGPVLKGKVNVWLRDWDEVLAFCSARNCDGGTGAAYVLLRKSR